MFIHLKLVKLPYFFTKWNIIKKILDIKSSSEIMIIIHPHHRIAALNSTI